MPDKSFDEIATELLRKNFKLASEFLDVARRENTPEELAVVLLQLHKAGYNFTVTAKAAKAKEAAKTPKPKAKNAAAATTATQNVKKALRTTKK